MISLQNVMEKIINDIITLFHTCEPVASKKLENFAGELAKKLENFVGHRHTDNLDKIMQK